MAKSSIEWTDKVWNPVTGCTKVSAGCAHCYAATVAKRFWGNRKFEDVQTHEDRLDQPRHWKKPVKIFVNSMSDLFHEDVSHEFIVRVLLTVLHCPQHTFQILTKRAERLGEFDFSFFNNVWLGVSVENQKAADERIPNLFRTPATVRFLSVEPMLEKIDIHNWLKPLASDNPPKHHIHWVICGGESGPGARPFNIEWARDLRDQCRDARVPFFMKQMGTNPINHTHHEPYHPGWPILLKSRKGGDVAEWPEDLRVREWPKGYLMKKAIEEVKYEHPEL